MTVYIITKSTCEWSQVVEVHIDKEDATKRMRHLEKTERYALDGDPYFYRIEEHVVIGTTALSSSSRI